MAQHDYVIDNASGLLVRGDMNAVLAAIVTNNSGNSEPSTKYPGMWWLDTSSADGIGILKIRNKANDGWINLPTANEYVPKTGGSILGDLTVTGAFNNPEFDAVEKSHAGAAAPGTPLPGMLWLDTSVTPEVMRIRNAANNAWNMAAPTNNPNFTGVVTVTDPTAAYIDLISQGESRRMLSDAPNNRMSFINPSGAVAAYFADNGDLWTSQTGLLSAALAAKQAALGYTPVQQGGGSSMLTNKVYIGWVSPGKLAAQIDSTYWGTIYTTNDPPPSGQMQWQRETVGAISFINTPSIAPGWGGNATLASQGGWFLTYGWDGNHSQEAAPGTWRNLGGGTDGDINFMAQRVA